MSRQAATSAIPQAGPRCTGLLLAPGASAGRDQPSLVAIDDAVSGKGIVVERMDFPYRLAGRRAPDRPAVLVGAVVEHASTLAARLDVKQNRIALGGRSMGGRMASMAVAEGLPAAGLVLVSYPLHPPGHPEKSRIEHLGCARGAVPVRFREHAMRSAPPKSSSRPPARSRGPVTHVWIEGGDHGLRRRDPDVASIVAEWLRGPAKGRKT